MHGKRSSWPGNCRLNRPSNRFSNLRISPRAGQPRLKKLEPDTTMRLFIRIIFLLFLLLGLQPGSRADSQAPARPKIGLALGGGGAARGAAHIGVLRVLEREGVPIDFIAGTSMGAIVGGLYAAGLSLDQIEQMLRNKSLQHAYDTVPIPVRFAAVPIFGLARMLGHHPYDGLYRGNKFANFITRSVPEERRLVQNAKIPFRAVAANLLDGKTVAISSGSLGRAIQASSAIPFFRRPVPLGDQLLIDGGTICNLPTDQARAMGADLVIAVDVDERIEPVSPDTFRAIGSVSSRSLNMVLEKLDRPETKLADIVIHPNVNGMRLMSRRVKEAVRAIHEGEKAAEESLPRIRERLSEQAAVSGR